MSTLLTYLADAGIRQDDFAASVGVTQATISKLVRGVARPSLDLAFAIARVTGGRVPVQSWDSSGADHTDPCRTSPSPNQEPSHDLSQPDASSDAA